MRPQHGRSPSAPPAFPLSEMDATRHVDYSGVLSPHNPTPQPLPRADDHGLFSPSHVVVNVPDTPAQRLRARGDIDDGDNSPVVTRLNYTATADEVLAHRMSPQEGDYHTTRKRTVAVNLTSPSQSAAFDEVLDRITTSVDGGGGHKHFGFARDRSGSAPTSQGDASPARSLSPPEQSQAPAARFAPRTVALIATLVLLVAAGFVVVILAVSGVF